MAVFAINAALTRAEPLHYEVSLLHSPSWARKGGKRDWHSQPQLGNHRNIGFQRIHPVRKKSHRGRK